MENMNEEEINKKIDYFNQYVINVSDDETEKFLREFMKVANEIIDLYNKEKEKNNKLTSLIYKLRNELKQLLISYDGEYYKPIKNTTKQEVYKSYFKVRAMVKGEYCFKDNETALKELLEEDTNE